MVILKGVGVSLRMYGMVSGGAASTKQFGVCGPGARNNEMVSRFIGCLCA